MKDLRIYVEEVVRPIQATWKRKLRMREELLLHLTDIHEEELRKGDGADCAFERTLERFGQPDELRSNLQASLPPRARAAYSASVKPRWTSPWAELGKIKDSETPARHSLRIALIHGALCVLLYVIVALASEALFTSSLWAHPLFSPAAFGFANGTIIFLFHSVFPTLLDRTFTEPSPVGRGLFGVAGFLFMLLAIGAVMLTTFVGLNGEIPLETRQWIASALAGSTGLFAPLIGYQFYSRKTEEWEALDLGGIKT